MSVIGQVGAGWLSDRFEVALIIAGLGIGSGVTALVAWGLADTLAKVFGFAILYGAFSGICSTWSTVAKDIAGAFCSNDALAKGQLELTNLYGACRIQPFVGFDDFLHFCRRARYRSRHWTSHCLGFIRP